MALTSITKDFITRAGIVVQGTGTVTSSTAQVGALQVNGGIAAAKNIIIGQDARVWGNTDLTGKLTVGGHATFTTFTATQQSKFLQAVTIDGTLTVVDDTFLSDLSVSGVTTSTTLNVTGQTTLQNLNAQLSTVTFLTVVNDATVGGTLAVTGATTLTDTLLVGKTLTANSSTAATSAGAGALVVTGGAYVGDNLIVNSLAFDTGTNTANALYVKGGAWIDKTLVVGGQVTFQDSVFFNGTATYVLSTNTVYTDNLLQIHMPPGGDVNSHVWAGDDGKDIGFIFHYYKGADKDAFLGFANDSGYLEWYENGTEIGGVFTGTTYGTFKTGDIKLTGTTDSSSTVSGSLQIAGGAGIGLAVYAGGNVSGATVTARNLTQNRIVIAGSGGQLTDDADLVWNGTSNQIEGRMAFANTSTNLAGGAQGSLPYQSGNNTTVFLPIGGQDMVLTVDAGVPSWKSAGGTTVGAATTATNIAGGSTGTIAYQISPGITGFTSNLTWDNFSELLTTRNVKITSNNFSTGTDTGALQVIGGVGISQDLTVGEDVTVKGDLYVDGEIYLQGIGLNQITASTGTFDYIVVEGTGTGLTVYDDAWIKGSTVQLGSSGANQLESLTANILEVRGGWGNNAGGLSLFAGNYPSTYSKIYLDGNKTITSEADTVTFKSFAAATLVTVSATTPSTNTGSGALQVAGGVGIWENLNVGGNTNLTGTLVVTGNSTLAAVTATLMTATSLTVLGNQTVSGTLGVTGRTTLNDTVVNTTITATNLVVTGSATLPGFTVSDLTVTNLTVVSNETIGGNLSVTGYSTFSLVTATQVTATSLTVIGNETVGGNLSVTGYSTFSLVTATQVTATSLTVIGNETVGGSLNVTGPTTVGLLTATTFTATSANILGTLAVAGIATFNDTTDSNATNAGSVQTLGGIGVAKAIYAGGAITVGATLAASAGNVVPALYSNNVLLASYTSPTLTGSSAANLDTFSASSYRTARYTVQVVDGGNIHITEITLFHNGTDVYLNEYGISTNNGELGVFDAELTSGNVTLKFTPTSASSMTIKVVRMGITA